jgi:hypothetical protein
MNARMAEFETSRLVARSQKVVAVVAFEDMFTRARANEVCRILASDFGRETEVLKQMWLTNMLRLPNLRSIAAEEAARADLIILSMHDAERLPEEVKTWIEMWLPRKARQHAFLLALFDNVYNGNFRATRTYLDEAARRAEMEWVMELDDPPRD